MTPKSKDATIGKKSSHDEQHVLQAEVDRLLAQLANANAAAEEEADATKAKLQLATAQLKITTADLEAAQNQLADSKTTEQSLQQIKEQLIGDIANAKDISIQLEHSRRQCEKLQDAHAKSEEVNRRLVGEQEHNCSRAQRQTTMLAELRVEHNSAMAAHKAAVAEQESALEQRDSAMAAQKAAMADRDSAQEQRDSAIAVHKVTMAERDSALELRDSAMAAHKAAMAERDSAQEQRDSALADVNLVRSKASQKQRAWDDKVASLEHRYSKLDHYWHLCCWMLLQARCVQCVSACSLERIMHACLGALVTWRLCSCLVSSLTSN